MHMYTSYNIQYIHQFVGCIKMYLYNFRDKQCVSEQTKYVKQNRKSQEQTITITDRKQCVMVNRHAELQTTINVLLVV